MLILLRQNIVEYLKANIAAYFFMILIFSIGIVLGALAVKILPDSQKMELVGSMHGFFQQLIQGSPNQFQTNMFWSVVLNYAKIIGVIWIMGFTIIGIPFVVFIVFTRGFVIGFTVGFLVNEYILKGLVFSLAAVLPHNFFAVPALITTGVMATTFSLMLLKRKNKINLISQAMIYSFLCLIMFLCTGVASIIEVYVSPVLMKWAALLFVGNG